MEPRRIIAALCATFILGCAVSFALNARQKKKEREQAAREVPGPNPLYEDLKKIGAPLGLNMEFAKQAVVYRLSFPRIEDSYVLSSPARSYDVLIVGDSSVAWGLIPEVIEQITGLSVGVFAAEGLTLNKTTAKVIRNVALHFLKENGLLILAFGDWTQEQPADSKVLVSTQWMEKVAAMSPAEFASFIVPKNIQTESAQTPTRCLSFLGFQEWRGIHGRVKAFVANDLGLSLNQSQFYAEYVEPFTNPVWHWIKKINLILIQGYLRWNNRSITVLLKDLDQIEELKRFRDAGKLEQFKVRSRRSLSPPNPSYRNVNVEQVAAIIKDIPRRKAVLVHFHSQESTYVKLRSIYNTYYRSSASLIDLGREHPADAAYPMDQKGHMINIGGMYESVSLGLYLKQHRAQLFQ